MIEKAKVGPRTSKRQMEEECKRGERREPSDYLENEKNENV